MNRAIKLIEVVDKILFDLDDPNFQLNASPSTIKNFEWIVQVIKSKLRSIKNVELNQLEKIQFAELESIVSIINQILRDKTISTYIATSKVEEIKKSITLNCSLFDKTYISKNTIERNLKVVKSPTKIFSQNIAFINQKANKVDDLKLITIAKAKEFIQTGKIKESFDLLIQYSKNKKIDEFENKFTLLSSRYSSLTNESRLLGKGESSDSKKNAVVSSLLEMIIDFRKSELF